MADAPIVSADFDGDGTQELVVVGRSYEWCPPLSAEKTRHNGIYIVNKDRTRYTKNLTTPSLVVDWREVPQPTNITGGKQACCKGMLDALSLDFTVIESANIQSVVADIDGDGILETLYSSYDGQLHVWWLDQTEKFQWPVAIGSPQKMRFSGPPVVVDLENDGLAEIIVATWGQNSGIPNGCSGMSCEMGEIIIFDYKGFRIANISLPAPSGTRKWNGILGSLTAGDFDGNGLLELVGVSANTGVVKYEVAGSTGFRILWGTGRGSVGRHGEAPSTVRTTGGTPRASNLGNGDVGLGGRAAAAFLAPSCLLVVASLLSLFLF